MGKKINFEHPKNFSKVGARGYSTPADATAVTPATPPDPVIASLSKKTPYAPVKPSMPSVFDTAQVPRP